MKPPFVPSHNDPAFSDEITKTALIEKKEKNYKFLSVPIKMDFLCLRTSVNHQQGEHTLCF